METVTESTTRLPIDLAYRAVTKIEGITYFSERLTHDRAEALLRNQPRGLVRIEGTRPKNGMLNGEVNELDWETI